ncbi:MAG: DNA repair exonuclease [Eubacteriales bacterium]|nr:DNA repair exonuclease [Eubacteriales bacterium]
MFRDIRIIHTADWHFGNPYRNYAAGLSRELRKQAFLALSELQSLIQKEACDLLVFAGDTFHKSLASMPEILDFDRFLSEVEARYIIVLAGNHDPYFPGSSWSKMRAFNDPRVILVAEDKPYYDLPELGLRIFARSFKAKQARKRLYPEKLESRADYYNLLIAHGELVQAGQSSLYQPLSKAWLEAQDIDLCLLGHIHQRQVQYLGSRKLPVIYPGSPQSLGWGECGLRGVEVIELLAGQRKAIKNYFLPLSGSRFIQQKIDLQKLLSEAKTSEAEQDKVTYLAGKILTLAKSWPEYRPERDLLKLDLYGELDFNLALSSLENYLSRHLFYLELNDYTQAQLDLTQVQEAESFIGAAYRESRKLIAATSSEQDELLINAAWNLLKRKYGGWNEI